MIQTLTTERNGKYVTTSSSTKDIFTKPKLVRPKSSRKNNIVP